MRTLFFGIAMFTAGMAAQAQAAPGGVQVGMTMEQLQQVVPGLHAVSPSRHAPRRLAASRWTSALEFAGVPLTASFVMADGQVQRIEYLAVPAAHDALLEWGRAAFGPEMASTGPEGQYASWSSDAVDAYLQRTASVVRLVVKRHTVKDASEL